MADVLSSIPGLAGYLAMEDRRRAGALGDLQATSGLLGLLQKQQEAERAAQMMPLQRQLMEAQVGQAQGLAAERELQQRFNAALPSLVTQATRADGGIDFGRLSELLIPAPGGLKPGMELRRAEEDRATRVETQNQNYLIKQQQLIDRRAAEERDAKNDAERIAARARYEQGILDLRREMVEARRSGSGGDARREPFKFSVDGKNVQGWRDRAGNVFGMDGKVISTYGPEILASDQKAEQDKQEAIAAGKVVEQNLARMEEIVNARPRSVAGPMAPTMNVLNYLSGQFGGERPATEFDQLIESTLNSAQKAGKLSNQQKNELRDMFKTGFFGDPDSVRKGIELMRQYSGIRGANAQAPVGRSRPQASQPSDEDLVNKYLRR